MNKEVTRVVTPIGTVSFPYIFRPNTFDGKTEYCLTLLYPQSRKAELKKLKQLEIETAKAKWGKLPKDIKKYQSPFKDGNDKDLDKYPNYEDMICITAKSKFEPSLINQSREDILDEKEFYAGCQARVSVTAYAWEFMGKSGVSFGLQNVQKAGEGERIGGRVAASDDFDELESDSAGDAGLDDFDV